MKFIYIVLMGLVFSGCSINSLGEFAFVKPYDSNEYLLITRIKSNAIYEKTLCPNVDIKHIQKDSLLFSEYQKGFSYNQTMISASQNLLTTIQTFRENPSKIYCIEKLDIVINSSEKIQKLLGDNR